MSRVGSCAATAESKTLPPSEHYVMFQHRHSHSLRHPSPYLPEGHSCLPDLLTPRVPPAEPTEGRWLLSGIAWKCCSCSSWRVGCGQQVWGPAKYQTLPGKQRRCITVCPVSPPCPATLSYWAVMLERLSMLGKGRSLLRLCSDPCLLGRVCAHRGL